MAPDRPWQTVVDALSRPPMPSGGVQQLYRSTLSELARHCSSQGLIKADEVIRDRTYCIRLYGWVDIAALDTHAGFCNIKVVSDASALNRGEDVGCINQCLVVSARKS